MLLADSMYVRKSCWLAIALVLIFGSRAIAAQSGDDRQERRKQAIDLVNAGKFVEALPMLEKLVKEDPNDGQAAFYLGSALQWASRLKTDPAERKQIRARGYSYLKQAHDLGYKNPVLEKMLASMKPDGGDDPSYSTNAKANEAMVAGEAAFAASQFDKAFEAYQQAFAIDSKLYEAALFAGDAMFKSGKTDEAGQWYGKAISSDPNREVAYRYWGDALLSAGKVEEARDKFVEAFITEPYNKLSAQGLIYWANKAKVALAHPKIEIPVNVTSPEKDKTKLTLDPKALSDKNPSASGWLIYGMIRAEWMSTKFQSHYPNEKQYRHSLAEEAEALSGAAKVAIDAAKEGNVKDSDESVTNLVALYKAGLIEPYVLLGRADAGVAQDYAQYLASNRDKLRRYVNEFVIHEAR